ncbi:MAG: hypothetical protein ACPGAB_07455 [Flavobacteriales bacterium]
MRALRFPLFFVLAAVCQHLQAQTTTLPDLDEGRLWVSPLAVLTTGLHAGYVFEEPSSIAGIRGARLEVNLFDRKARAYAMWRQPLTKPGLTSAFRECGVGFANVGTFGGRRSALGWQTSGPSVYLAWGHSDRTLEWRRGRGKGTMPMTVMWGIRAEWLARRNRVSDPEYYDVGLFLPLFVRIQLPVG